MTPGALLFATVPAAIAAGGMAVPSPAAAVDLKLQVPGDCLLVDHALSRAARGLVGELEAEGPEQPDIYRSNEAQKLGMIMQ